MAVFKMFKGLSKKETNILTCPHQRYPSLLVPKPSIWSCVMGRPRYPDLWRWGGIYPRAL